jgi:thymidylate synthase
MNTYDIDYLKLIENIMINGTNKDDRTGIGTRSLTGTMIKHNMNNGFPALTTKKLFFNTMATELEGFLKGITSKQWFKDHGCNIWNNWCRPDIIPKGLSNLERIEFQRKNDDLGPIYGAQWNKKNKDGYSQIDHILNELRHNPISRRMVVSAWNHNERKTMALEPCHVLWQVVTRDNYLDLVFYMRSVDTFIGMPFDIASYGLLLSLLAKQFNYIPGILTGFFADTHIYNNHFDQVQEQVNRFDKIKPLPNLDINRSFYNIKDFNAQKDVSLFNYLYEPAIKAEVAI